MGTGEMPPLPVGPTRGKGRWLGLRQPEVILPEVLPEQPGRRAGARKLIAPPLRP